MWQKLYRKAKDDFPYKQCFKQLCNEQEVERENSNYSHLLEGMLGHICLQAQSDFRDIVSTLECYIIDPRRNGDQKYLVDHPHNSICCTTQQGATIGSTSEDTITDRVSNTNPNQSTGDTSEEYFSELSPPKSSERVKQLLREPIKADDLERYTQVVMELCSLLGWNPCYAYCDKVLSSRVFTCTVTLAGLKAVGSECKSKKEAKHKASKILWGLLRVRFLG